MIEPTETELSRTAIGNGRSFTCSIRTFGDKRSLVVAEICPDGRTFKVRVPVTALQALREAALLVADAAAGQAKDMRQPGTRGKPRGEARGTWGGATTPLPSRPARGAPAPPGGRGST